MSDSHLSTPESRAQARREVEEAHARLAEVRRRWPEVRRMRALALRAREENNFGPKVRRMLEA